ncbi:MAG: hypothetical protein ACOVNL_13675 [Prochlorococcaceae cyanobacterium]|jgi:hypothetical protein
MVPWPAHGLTVLGPHLPGKAADPAAATAVQAIVTVNPMLEARAADAIVSQERLRIRRELWRLDTTPPTRTLW